MTDNSNPFDAMMKMGQDWVAQMNPAMKSFVPKGMDGFVPTMPHAMMETFFGKRLNPDGLDVKTRLMLTLMGLVVTGAQAEDQIKLTVRHLIEAGATQREVGETIAQAGLFGGVPAMTLAMKIATDEMNKESKA